MLEFDLADIIRFLHIRISVQWMWDFKIDQVYLQEESILQSKAVSANILNNCFTGRRLPEGFQVFARFELECLCVAFALEVSPYSKTYRVAKGNNAVQPADKQFEANDSMLAGLAQYTARGLEEERDANGGPHDRENCLWWICKWRLLI